MYINLLRSHKKMNMEFHENNKIIEALKEKLMKEIAKNVNTKNHGATIILK